MVCLSYSPLEVVGFTNLETGNAPYELIYEEHAKPDASPKFMRKKSIHAALSSATIQLETAKAGSYEYRLNELSDQNYDHDSRRFSPIILQQRVHPRPGAKFAHPGKVYNFCSAGAADNSGSSGDEVIPITLTGVPPFHVEVEVKSLGSAKPNTLTFDNIPSTSYNMRIPHKYLRDGTSHISLRSVRDSRGCEARPSTDSPGAGPKVSVAMHDAPSVASMETSDDYCVGEYVSFRLSGSPPFEIFYTFRGKARTATSNSHSFRRIIDEPGEFSIEAITDSASDCKSRVQGIRKVFHPKPRGSVSKGKDTRRDIHEGGEDEIVFDFVGTPPFEFSYVRRAEGKSGRGPGQVLETKTERTEDVSVRRKVSAEGEYELVSLKDAWCLTTRNRGGGGGGKEQKLLMNK